MTAARDIAIAVVDLVAGIAVLAAAIAVMIVTIVLAVLPPARRLDWAGLSELAHRGAVRLMAFEAWADARALPPMPPPAAMTPDQARETRL